LNKFKRRFAALIGQAQDLPLHCRRPPLYRA
jgi:hypothetical protein